RKAPSLSNEMPENSSKSGELLEKAPNPNSFKPSEENYQRTVSKFSRNLPENNSKSGEENYKGKSPNPAKKLEAEAELEKLSEIRNLPENSSKSGEEIARESSKPGKENYQKKAQTCSKPGEENYERNLAKKIEAEAELDYQEIAPNPAKKSIRDQRSTREQVGFVVENYSKPSEENSSKPRKKIEAEAEL
ncbi:7502_t:CDS:2, partial [Dentiscutata heterogama]